MAQAQQQKILTASVDQVYKLISNFDNYPELIPEVQKVDHVESTPQGEVYEMTVELMKEVTYQIQVKFEDQKQISWELYNGDGFKKNSGLWTFKSLGQNQTLLKYSLEIDFNFFVPSFLVEKTIKAQLPKLFEAVESKIKTSC